MSNNLRSTGVTYTLWFSIPLKNKKTFPLNYSLGVDMKVHSLYTPKLIDFLTVSSFPYTQKERVYKGPLNSPTLETLNWKFSKVKET